MFPMFICGCLLVEIDWLYPFLCMCTYTWEGLIFKARAVKDFALDMIKIELTNIPVKSGIVYLYVDGFLYGSG